MDELVKLLDGTLQWSLEFDWHAGNYQDINTWADDHLAMTDDPDERRNIEACRASGHVWWLQVYPSTPIGFYFVYAPTFDAMLEWARNLRRHIEFELSMRQRG